MLKIVGEETVQEIVDATEEYLVRQLKYRRGRIELNEALLPLLSIWCGSNRNNRYSRHIYVSSFYTTITVNVNIAPQDSIASLLSFFDAVECAVSSTSWNCSTNSQGKTYKLSVGSFRIDFDVRIAESNTCKIVPKYEMQRIRVGQTVVCNGNVM